MAKSRKQQIGFVERRERLLGTCSGYGGGTTTELSSAGPDFTEEDVWSTGMPAQEQLNSSRRSQWVNLDRKHDRSWHDRNVVGGLSLAFDHHRSWHGGVGSAPVNVPTWRRTDEEEDDDADEEDEWVPPHEYLARGKGKRGGGGGAVTSVLEGVGRTLKGRDMRRVRDAVWSQTGFFG